MSAALQNRHSEIVVLCNMKLLLAIIVLTGIIGLGFINKKKIADNKPHIISPKPLAGTYAPVALLELFTSEGCSSCPPADRLLPELAKLDSNIIPLSFHVDYWNRLGWADPFSSSEYSERQREYAKQLNHESVYTPQLVINGEYELVGSSRSKAESIIKIVLEEKAAVRLSMMDVKTSEGKIVFVVTAEGDYKGTTLHAALVQKQATIQVKAGENSGAKLSHVNVVRSYTTEPTTGRNELKLNFPAHLANDNWQLVVYTQQKNDLKINGAGLYDPK